MANKWDKKPWKENSKKWKDKGDKVTGKQPKWKRNSDKVLETTQEVEKTYVGAWEVKRSWEKSDISKYNDFATKKLPEYATQNVLGDCADLAIRLLIDYAFEEKLLVDIETADQRYRLKSNNKKYIDKAAFLDKAMGRANAASLAKFDTILISQENKISGDIFFAMMDQGIPHHTMLAIDDATLEATYGSSNVVVYDNPEPTHLKVGRNPYSDEGSVNNPLAISRWKCLDFGGLEILLPGPNAYGDDDMQIIPEDE